MKDAPISAESIARMAEEGQDVSSYFTNAGAMIPPRVICIYCDDPDTDSESHIIAEGLGKGPTLKSAVCAKCNHRINSDIEEEVVKGLAPIRHYLQLVGKRGERARLDVKVSYGDKTQRTSARTPLELLSKVHVFKEVTDGTGKKREIAAIASDESKVQEVKARFEAKHTGTVLTPIPSEQIINDLKYETEFDFAIFADQKCLRMVAKIALEWWCANRNPEVIKGAEYSNIIRYINDGDAPKYPIVSLVSDKATLDQFWPIPFGCHVLFISTDVNSNNLVVLVGLFGLVYYKVIVSREYPRLHTYQQLTLVHPQTGAVNEVDNRIKPPNASKLQINEITRLDHEEPLAVMKRMRPVLLERLNDGMGRIWQESTKPTREESSESSTGN